MAFVVEDGTGRADATSYASVAEADAYHTDYGNPSAWSSATTAAKQTALMQATQYLESKYGRRWLGTRATSGQALGWPRFDAVDGDGYVYASNAVPVRLKQATSYLALRALSETLVVDLEKPGAIAGERSKVGELETETQYMGGRSQVKAYRLADALVQHLVFPLGSLDRG